MSESTSPSADVQISGLLFAVLLVGPDDRIAEANHAAEDILGQSARRMVGTSFRDAVKLPIVALDRVLNSDERIVARGLELADADTRLVNLTVSPLATHTGWRVITFSDAGQDDLRDETDASSALKAPAILAHEIKNPLAAIKGASQLLSRKVDAVDSKMTQMIVDEVDRIARLIDRMQELGSTSLEEPEAVNLHQVVRKALTSVASAKRGLLVLSEEFDPSLPKVLAVPDALEQILVNLISNAADAVDGLDDPRIVVRTRFVSGLATGGGQRPSRRLPVEVAVCDNGPGLDPAIAESAFEPFVTSKKNGQGLGLALVKKLTHQLGGRISHVRNETRGVTEFRIHLALAE